MLRTFLVCLPLCLIMAPGYPGLSLDVSTSATVEHVADSKAVKTDGSPDPAKDALGFLRACLKRYDESVQGYTLSFWKQERIGTKLHSLEIIDVAYREHPYTVFFNWQQGERLAKKCLFIEGENRDAKSGKCLMLVLPAGALQRIGVVKRDPEGSEAKSSGRYPISAFGLKQAMERVYKAWAAADANKSLDVTYQGLNIVQETGGKTCHTFLRKCYNKPEEDDGVAEVVVYIDCETLLQVGTIVKNERAELLATYYFKDIRLNPTFEPGRFEAAAVKK
jgi:Protein of unknown function (DUF1571)